MLTGQFHWRTRLIVIAVELLTGRANYSMALPGWRMGHPASKHRVPTPIPDLRWLIIIQGQSYASYKDLVSRCPFPFSSFFHPKLHLTFCSTLLCLFSTSVTTLINIKQIILTLS